MEDSDTQTQMKKRARRRLVGALFFVSVVALVLPMIMDQEARPPLQDVEIHIPGQNERAFEPRLTTLSDSEPPSQVPEAPVTRPAATAATLASLPKSPTSPPIAAEAAPERQPEVVQKPPEKPAEKPVDRNIKPETAKTGAADEARRAAAILAGKVPEAAAASGEYLVLIGAFSNPGNVSILRKKLGELGIRVITENLDTPQGRKIRVRAGPFPSRDAAEKALVKMQRIGVGGQVAAKP